MQQVKIKNNKNIPLLLFILILFGFFILIYLNRSLVVSQGRVVVASYGLFGVFILSFIMDVIIQPLSPDLVVFGTTLLRNQPFTVALAAGLGSVLAGTTDYYFGRKYGTRSVSRYISKKTMQKGNTLFARWGTLAVIVGALSPIPYSAICYLAGTYRMNLKVFLFTSLATRIPRFLFFAFLASYVFN